MTQYEYKWLEVKESDPSILDKLNEAGREGWRVVPDPRPDEAGLIFLMERETPTSLTVEGPKDNLFFGEQTIMVYMDDNNQGKCRWQSEPQVQHLAATTPQTIYYFLDEKA